MKFGTLKIYEIREGKPELTHVFSNVLVSQDYRSMKASPTTETRVGLFSARYSGPPCTIETNNDEPTITDNNPRKVIGVIGSPKPFWNESGYWELS